MFIPSLSVGFRTILKIYGIDNKLAAMKLIELLRKHNLKLVTAESCTAGQLGSFVAAMEGASEVYEGGYVTYSHAAKSSMLGIAKKLLEEKGAISPEVAAQMARGAISHSPGNISLAITGVAGPASTEGKPVGLVYIAYCYKNDVQVTENNLKGGCDAVKDEAVSRAIKLAISNLEKL